MLVYDVIIAGAGPAGTMLAAELRLHDVRVLVLERDTEPVSAARIVSLQIRSLEILAMRGLLDRIRAHGRQRPAGAYFAAIDKPAPPHLDTAHGYLLGVRQPVLVDLLEQHAITLGAEVRRGAAVTGFDQDPDGVTVALADGSRVRARYLVGCDGGRSSVRRILGVGFPGEPARFDTLMGEVRSDLPPDGIAARVAEIRRSRPRFGFDPIGAGAYRVLIHEVPVGDHREPPTAEDFREHLRAVAGTDFGVHTVGWSSRFGDATRLADSYRVGRVLLAGDAAHIHPPIGGQGLNLGLQDAVNLGWKLAAEVHGRASDTLLDTYESERRPVAAEVLAVTRAQVALLSPGPGAEALRRLFTELMDLDEVNRHLLAKMTAIGVRYDCGPGPDLLGRRLPDPEGRFHPVMHRGRGLLVDRTGTLTAGAWSDRVDRLDDPDVGLSVLVRPDGHVAWIGAEQQTLDVHLAHWFGRAEVHSAV
ncbi:FAD-dependent monooxygenase [Actinoplanes sp. NBRC 101535]|uniref:FAD-dependent monooxygenase n=1 Tax=Actinoplanes sp. NBRC 101535 TaxID=3032196 RepID=UPI00249FADF7|nr:FAD-dependent oxidoreductase [Actinoplanes sp. NBRC 101535]